VTETSDKDEGRGAQSKGKRSPAEKLDASNPPTTVEGAGGSGGAENPPYPWFAFVANNDEAAVVEELEKATEALIEDAKDQLGAYRIVALCDTVGPISSFTADRIYTALSDPPGGEDQDVLLVLLSRGGAIEPAYQISKLCRARARGKFVVAVPREAKSAATLVAIGADQIHMGPLSHLGPIDPQLGQLPALGVVQALETIAALAQKFPGSWEMLSRYLQRVLTVEQIGYCQRISESAIQYAERLLMTKPEIRDAAQRIARELVYEYKDHGFVIDIEEARDHLGASWILDNTAEIAFADRIYRIFEEVNLGLRYVKKKYLSYIGNPANGFVIFDLPE